MRCSSCQFENPEQMRFCGQCGVALAASCASCGAELPDGFRFCGQCGHEVGAAPPTPTARPQELEQDEWHVAILAWAFATTDGAGALAQEIDRLIIDAGGHRPTHPAEQQLAFFGYPQNLENDSHRAVHVALAMLAEQAARYAETRLRCFVHTCDVTFDATSGVASGTALADATAHLKHVPWDEVTVSEQTGLLVDRFFDLGPPTALGTRQVLGTNADATPRYHSTTATRSPFIGRAAEVEAIAERIYRAAQQPGQIVQICGEPGIGKSRLLAELTENVAAGWTTLSCMEIHQQSAYAAVIEYLLHHVLPASLASAEDAWLIDQICGRQGEHANDSSLTGLSAKQIRERTYEALERLFLGGADQPAVLVVEDLHWADPSTLDLLRWLAPRVASKPGALVLTYRPEFVPPWPHGHNTLDLYLQPLGTMDATRLVSHVAKDSGLSDAQVRLLVERTDGVPFFLEELTRMMMHHAQQGTPELSDSLREMLDARLDQLGAGKQLLQCAAVLGRTFHLSTLGQLYPSSEERMAQLVVELLNENVLVQERTRGSLSFRHVLLQEAAYASLSAKARAELHGQAAHVLRQPGALGNPTKPEVIADHLVRADRAVEALPYLIEAGDQATFAATYNEGEAFYRRGLQLLRGLPRDQATEIKLESGIGRIAALARGFGDVEVGRAYGRVALLAEQSGNRGAQLAAMNRLVFHHTTIAQHEAALAAAKSADEVAIASGGLHSTTQSKVATILPLWHLGQPVAARQAAAEAMELLKQTDDEALRASIQFWTTNYASQPLWSLGAFQQVRDNLDTAEQYARRALDPYRLAQSLSYGSTAYIYLGTDVDRFTANLREARRVSIDHGFDVVRIWSELYLGWMAHGGGDTEEAARTIRNAIEETLSYRSRFAMPFAHTLLARCLIGLDQIDGAARAVEDGLSYQAAHQELSHHTELLRVRAIVQARRGQLDSARADLNEGLSVATQQRAKGWELRTLTTLGALDVLADDQRPRLQALLADFASTPELPDVADARAQFERRA